MAARSSVLAASWSITSASIRNMPTWSANSHDPDRHIRQSIELAEQHISPDHGADIFRRAGIDDVAGLQLESFREFCDLLGDAPDHLVEVGGLADVAVDRERNCALGEVAGLARGMDRADHGGMVEALADFPRLLLGRHAVLQITPRHVEAERIAVDM